MDKLIESLTVEQAKALFNLLDFDDGADLLDAAYELRSALTSSLRDRGTYQLVANYPKDSSPGFHVEVWRNAQHLFNVHFATTSISDDAAFLEVNQRIDEFIERMMNL